ncbi:hypothetical protein [Candidatus Magnetobacterium casense]|uniref:Uncharacterized protein n=1 Tax=Candidatus Magnetobacterium casense TaxID=1455061 RepID=A0ABS6S3B7_9BACT|nr:hypothetical protein [Candidatus Magnetobacterium casensis]MBV6343340.1 hypothetical protein [Candidatus Magnetobacterium casensis]
MTDLLLAFGVGILIGLLPSLIQRYHRWRAERAYLGMDICLNGAEHTTATIVKLRNGVVTVDQSWPVSPQTDMAVHIREKADG